MPVVTLEDVFYFSVIKRHNPPLFELVRGVVQTSMDNPNDKKEIQRRLLLLTKSSDAEHLRQASNFLGEAHAFAKLSEEGHDPHWVPEARYKTPDLQYGVKNLQIPVEVKHLNSPRDEHDALYRGDTWGGSVDKNYQLGLEKKIQDFVAESKLKFKSFNQKVSGLTSEAGMLYMYFSKSVDASIVDLIAWEDKMHDRIKAIAEPLVGRKITLVIIDINKIVEK